MATVEERGFLSMLRLRGRNLKVISAGAEANKTFRATINRIGAYALSTEIGDDPRGKRIMETPVTGCPAISGQMVIQDTGNSEKFKVTQIGLDSPAYSKKYELLQGVPGKDDWA